jgi:nucleotide-binding universal stress UspA family protein
MFRTALVALDRSQADASLIEGVPDLRSWGVERIVLGHVLRIGYVQGGSTDVDVDVLPWLEEHAAPLREAGLDLRFDVARSGVPGRELVAMSDRHGADLLVIGSRSHGFVHELVLGSVAREVIRAADRPVLLQRITRGDDPDEQRSATPGERTLRRVLLATDLSEHSRGAEEVAVLLAAAADRVDVMTVAVDDGRSRPGPAAGDRDAQLGSLADRIRDHGADVEVVLETGEAAQLIADRARSDYTLVIVGKQGRHWIPDRVIGATSTRISETTQRPVLLVPLPRSGG